MPQASRSHRDLRGILRLYLVTDPELCSQHGLLETVRDAVRGGVSVVQLRDKTATTSALVGMGRDLAAVLADTGVPLVVNDNVEAAIAIGADGIHVGQGDMKVEEVRQLVGPDMILGLSCATVEDAIQTPADLVDYIGVSPYSRHQPRPTIALLLGLTACAPLLWRHHCQRSPSAALSLTIARQFSRMVQTAWRWSQRFADSPT